MIRCGVCGRQPARMRSRGPMPLQSEWLAIPRSYLLAWMNLPVHPAQPLCHPTDPGGVRPRPAQGTAAAG